MKRTRWKEPKPKKIKVYKGRNLRRRSWSDIIPKRALLLLLFPVSWFIVFLCKHNATLAEKFFFQKIYRPISIGYSYLTGKIPFSIYEILLYILIIAAVLFVIFGVKYLWKSKGNRGLILRNFLLNIACIVSVVLFIEVLLCAVNYYRYSFTYYSGLNVQKSTVQELYDVCLDLASNANELRQKTTQRDEEGVFAMTPSMNEIAKMSNDAMESLGKDYPILAGWNTSAKKILLSKYMSYTETTGIFCTFTMEANVNTDIAAYSIPYTMCHELSHLRGFMREDEANFLAYLACIEYDDVEFQYCGTMLALIHAGNALYRQDSQLYSQLRSTYSEGVLLDLAANNRYWRKYQDTVVSTISNKVNDTYLKINNQSDGVQSYGRMVDLVLAYYREKK